MKTYIQFRSEKLFLKENVGKLNEMYNDIIKLSHLGDLEIVVGVLKIQKPKTVNLL